MPSAVGLDGSESFELDEEQKEKFTETEVTQNPPQIDVPMHGILPLSGLEIDYTDSEDEKTKTTAEATRWNFENISTVVIFLLLHAFSTLAFQRVEVGHTNDLINEGVKFKNYFKNKWQISDGNWEEFQEEAQTLVSFPIFNPWEDFTRTFSFVATISTTLGYGNMSPLTDTGKILTCVLGIFLIGVTLVVMYHLYSLERYLFKVILRFIERRTGYTLKSVFGITACHFFWITVQTILLFDLVQHANKDAMERASIDRLYTSFQLWTTIGFGDFILPLKEDCSEGSRFWCHAFNYCFYFPSMLLCIALQPIWIISFFNLLKMSYRVQFCGDGKEKDKEIVIRSTGLEMDFYAVYGRRMTFLESGTMNIRSSFVIRD